MQNLFVIPVKAGIMLIPAFPKCHFDIDQEGNWYAWQDSNLRPTD